MYALLVLLFSLMIMLVGAFSNKWNSPVAPALLPTVTAQIVASNIYNYASTVKQYAESNCITNQAIGNMDMSAYQPTNLSKMGDYQALIVTDSTKNTYEILSWNTIIPNTTTINDVNSQLINLTSQVRNPYGTSWFIPLVIQNNNCQPTILNGYFAPIQQNLSGYKTLFTTLCGLASAMGAGVAKNALVIQLN